MIKGFICFRSRFFKLIIYLTEILKKYWNLIVGILRKIKRIRKVKNLNYCRSN